MKGGAIEFSFIPFTPNGRQNLSNVYTKQGTNLLLFIDGTKDTFFNTFRRVKFSKSCSKVYFYLTDDGERIEDPPTPFQLIYQTDNIVYQYNTTEIKRLRLVKQNSQMSEDDVKKLLTVTPQMLGTSITSIETLNQNPTYRQWEAELYHAIVNGQISIDQIINFYFKQNGSPNFSGRSASKFWTKFHQKYERDFF